MGCKKCEKLKTEIRRMHERIIGCIGVYDETTYQLLVSLSQGFLGLTIDKIDAEGLKIPIKGHSPPRRLD